MRLLAIFLILFISQTSYSAEPVYFLKGLCEPELYFFEVRIIRLDNSSIIGKANIEKHTKNITEFNCTLDGVNYFFESRDNVIYFMRNDGESIEEIISEVQFSDDSYNNYLDKKFTKITSLQVWGNGKYPLIFLDVGYHDNGQYYQQRIVLSSTQGTLYKDGYWRQIYNMVRGVKVSDSKLSSILNANKANE